MPVPIRVLMVEDNSSDAELLARELRRAGFDPDWNRVETKADYLTALIDSPDIILSDYKLPQFDGLSALRLLQERASCLSNKTGAFNRLWLLPQISPSTNGRTATYTDSSDKELALNLGAERFIVKPEEPNAFMNILRETLDQYKTGRLVAPREPVEEEEVFLKEYNEALVRKLEDKMVELERANSTIKRNVEDLDRRVAERTGELRKLVNAMAGREVRMAELKEVIRKLRAQLFEAGLTPSADDPLREGLEDDEIQS